VFVTCAVCSGRGSFLPLYVHSHAAIPVIATAVYITLHSGFHADVIVGLCNYRQFVISVKLLSADPCHCCCSNAELLVLPNSKRDII
jgi:hypothetical protein